MTAVLDALRPYTPLHDMERGDGRLAFGAPERGIVPLQRLLHFMARKQASFERFEDRLVRREGNPRLMKRLARATGGESYSPRDVDDVPEAFEKIAKDIRSAYTLAYIPTASGAAAERRRRTVRVYVRGPDGKALNVRTRDGYFQKTHEAGQ